jgi:hypothetical protein
MFGRPSVDAGKVGLGTDVPGGVVAAAGGGGGVVGCGSTPVGVAVGAGLSCVATTGMATKADVSVGSLPEDAQAASAKRAQRPITIKAADLSIVNHPRTAHQLPLVEVGAAYV